MLLLSSCELFMPKLDKKIQGVWIREKIESYKNGNLDYSFTFNDDSEKEYFNEDGTYYLKCNGQVCHEGTWEALDKNTVKVILSGIEEHLFHITELTQTKLVYYTEYESGGNHYKTIYQLRK